MAIDVRYEIKGVDELKRKFGRYRASLPLAEAKALTFTAERVRDAETAGTVSDLARPVPFTVKAMGLKSARVKDLEAKVFVKDKQRQYLNYPIRGDKQGKMIRPANVKLNRYGNMPRKLLKRLLARPDVFFGTIKGYTGLWQRGRRRGSTGFSTEVKAFRGAGGQTGYKFKKGNEFRNVRLLALRVDSIDYDEQFKFYEIGEREAQRVYLSQFAKTLNLAGSKTFGRGGGL